MEQESGTLELGIVEDGIDLFQILFRFEVHSPLQELIADPKVMGITERAIYSKDIFSMIPNVFIDGLT